MSYLHLLALSSCLGLITLAPSVKNEDETIVLHNFNVVYKRINDVPNVWIQNFEQLQTTISSNNADLIAPIIQFPIATVQNEIWKIVLPEEEFNTQFENEEKNIAFNKEDFAKYYDKLFPSPFITALRLIKSADLNKHKHMEVWVDSINTTLYATYDDKAKMLYLNYYQHAVEGKSKEITIAYKFAFIQNKFLLKEVRSAG
jgi:hypothetical protein